MTKVNNNTIKYRVAQAEKIVDCVDEKVDLILNNQLPHMNERIVENKTWIKVATAINVGAVIISKFI